MLATPDDNVVVFVVNGFRFRMENFDKSVTFEMSADGPVDRLVDEEDQLALLSEKRVHQFCPLGKIVCVGTSEKMVVPDDVVGI